MKISNQYSRDHEDDTYLEIDGIEDSIHRERETGDLLLKQGLHSQIDIVLEQESHGQDAHDTEGDIDLEFEGIEGDDRCAPVTFDSRRDYSSSQPKTTEVLFDDDVVILNSKNQNSITRFQLGETFQPSNVRTWGPKLVAKWCMQLAKQGNHRAQYRLGCMYALGFGVQRNYIMAYTWCKISALRDSTRASLRLKKIEPNLTTMHIYYARKLSRQYYEKYVIPFSHR
jgi:TPR repeat protein